ncbi:hypothetical protein [Armatimonas sp.]|uniref:hypothetical protein n=1 Tax=Armatimonas sp. TaxID=1872638 RepID=UPI00374D366B
MPKVRVFRTLPKAGSSPGKAQTRVIEVAANMPLPMGAVVVADEVETTDWVDVTEETE